MTANVLSEASIRKIAPAVFATDPAPDTSSRYGFISTAALMEELLGRDFVVTSARQDRVAPWGDRSPLTERHELRFAHQSFLDPDRDVGDHFPQITLVNEHRGHNKAHIGTGVYRLVCLNGMIVGRQDAAYTLRHTTNAPALIDAALPVILAAQDRAVKAIEHWEEIELTVAQQQRFAEEALKLRFSNPAAYTVDAALETRRAEDEGSSLWRVFNRVQENLTQHSISGRSSQGRTIRSRPLTGITLDAKFNAGLWNVAEAFA